MTRKEVATLLLEKQWSVTALAERWGKSRRWVTAKIADEYRGVLWDDAFRGLPKGSGFYRRNKVTKSCSAQEDSLKIGGLVASEGEFDSFGYGSRGVVVEVRGKNEWLVVWDGGTEMVIDQSCLDEWVVDLGLVNETVARTLNLDLPTRIEIATRTNLY